MDISKEERQRGEFRNILFDLAESQLALKEGAERSKIYKRLEDLYYSPDKQNEFRHFYSDIFSTLSQIQLDDKKWNIDILGQNLLEIRKGYQAINLDENGKLIDISDNIRKLYDHVSLDIARMRYSDAGDRKTSGEEALRDMQSQVNAMSENMQSQVKDMSDNINTVQKAAEEKIANQQKEYIAILGIFAAVVLAFTGGITFSSSVLNNISQASIYRLMIVSLVIGLVLVNILFGLFFYINKIVREEEKISPLITSNVVIIILIALTVVLWCCGVVENRDKRVNYTGPSSTIQTEFDVSETDQ